MAEAFIDRMSFSTEQKDRLKKLVDENMLTLRAITQTTNDQLKSKHFPIGAKIELKAKDESDRIATRQLFKHLQAILLLQFQPPRDLRAL